MFLYLTYIISILKRKNITEKDRSNIECGIEQGIDFISASFVRKVSDVLAIIVIAASKGANLNYLIWHAGTWGIFPDFYESLKDASLEIPYETGAIYPALAYVVLWIISGLKSGSLDEWGIFSTTPGGFLIGILFFIVCTLIFFSLIKNKIEMSNGKSILLYIALLLSPGYIFMIERGNIVILVAIFVALYLFNYNSESLIAKESALVALAIATSFKLYPAVLGLLLIIYKKYKVFSFL